MDFGALWKNREGLDLNGRVEFPVDVTLKAGVRYMLWLNHVEHKEAEKMPDYRVVLTASK